MKAKEFLEWYRYSNIGGKRMKENYAILRRHNPQAFEKLSAGGKFKYKKIEMGDLLLFPSELECDRS